MKMNATAIFIKVKNHRFLFLAHLSYAQDEL